MLALTDTTHSLEVTTSSAADLDYAVSWVDVTTTAFTPGSSHGTIASATTTTIAAAPGASTQRGIKHVSLRNRHASTSQTVTVKKDVSATEYELAEAVLGPGESLVYEAGAGWALYNATGQPTVSQSTGAPSGPAGGDLSGTYPNPSVSDDSHAHTSGTLPASIVYDGDAAGGDLTGTYPSPTISSGAVTDAKVAAANKDGVAGTASMRTLGTGAQQACAGNDARLSDARTPTAHATSHQPGGGDAMAVDAAAATGSLRTLGTGATQACAGNDSRLSDSRTPTAHASSHNAGGGDALAIDAAAGTGSLRTLGTSSTSACAGNDSRLSDARTPTAHKTSHQSGGSDAIKLDDLAAPDDNTDLNVSTSLHGLVPKAPNGKGKFLRGDAAWALSPAQAAAGIQMLGGQTGSLTCYHTSPVCRWGYNTSSPASGTILAVPYLPPRRGGTIDRIAAVVTTGESGKNCRLAIYDCVSVTDIYPNALQAESGAISIAAAGMVTYDLGTPLVLDPEKVYWLALNTDGVSTGRYHFWSAGDMAPLLGFSSAGGWQCGLYYSSAFGAFPATFSASASIYTAASFFVPALFVRHSA